VAGQVPRPPVGRPEDPALATYLAELNERLVVHWTGGAWRVPLSDRHLALHGAGGSVPGRIVCAGAEDARRAAAGLIPAPLSAESACQALAAYEPLMTSLPALERGPRAPSRPPIPPAPPPGRPWLLLTAADVPVRDLVALLVAGSGQGVIWKPAPGAAASAHLVMRALAPLAGRALAMLQGDHASGQALAGLGVPVWAAAGPMPQALR